MISPELIKVEFPQKQVYDFRKKTNNYQLMNSGIYDQYDCEKRYDSKVVEEDLKTLEIELKRKQEKRIKKQKKEEEEKKQRPQSNPPLGGLGQS